MSEKPTVSALEKVEAILNNPEIYELAHAIPGPVKSGRRRDYPTYMILVFNSLLSVWRSGRQVEAELSHPLVWRHMRRIVRRRFPDDPLMHLPQQPMRRHHYIYGRDRYLTDPTILERLGEIHRELAAGQAKEAGLLDPDGPGSYTHPDLSRILHADGKVVTPLFKARPGQFRVDAETGEVIPVRYEAEAKVQAYEPGCRRSDPVDNGEILGKTTRLNPVRGVRRFEPPAGTELKGRRMPRASIQVQATYPLTG